MKKISYLIISLILLINIVACNGYKPVFSSSNLKFKIADYSIKGDKKLGNQLYSKLYSLSQSNENTENSKNIYILIHVSKNKNATAKDLTGKILSYKINLTTEVKIKDVDTGNQILSESFFSSSTYKVQDQYSETKKMEDRSVENLMDKTYQDLLIKLSENIL